jgi:N-acetylglucosaminyldiphosphoundecaprenol N-acetyl-beta-D-mannosaminyltransferase
LRERVPGSDTVELIASIAARDGLRMFLLGAAPGVAGEAARRLGERHPGLVIAGTHAGSPAPSDEAEIGALINGARADILLVAYGAPKQELWIERNLAKLPVRLAMSVGGTFDFLAGVKARAPRWMQRAGLEWLFRLAQEPSRWRRMLALPKFAFLAFTEQLTGRA